MVEEVVLGKCGWHVQSEECFIERGVNVPVDQEFEGVCKSSFLCDNYEWACSFVCEFLLWLWEMEVGCIEPYLVSYLILDCQEFLLVVLHLLLVHSFLE